MSITAMFRNNVVQSDTERSLRFEHHQLGSRWCSHKDENLGLSAVRLAFWGWSKYGLDHKTTVLQQSVFPLSLPVRQVATGCVRRAQG
jgi:hypothetical protein